MLLVDAIIHHEEVYLTDHLAHLDAVHSDVTKDREDQFRLLLSSMLPGLPSLTSRAVQRAVDSHTSGWLNVLPLAHHHFDLSAQQFCDALCLCYHRPLSLLPASCDGCGGDFSLTHARDETILQYIDILQYLLLQYNTIRLKGNIDILHIAIYCDILQYIAMFVVLML